VFATNGIAVGNPDPSFGADGTGKVVTLNSSAGYRVATQANGRIITAGGSADFEINRYTADGSLDTTFGSGGHVISDLTGSGERVDALAVQPDDKILVAGTGPGGAADWLVARYNADGSLDNTFGVNGVVTMDWGAGAGNLLHDLTIAPDGRIL